MTWGQEKGTPVGGGEAHFAWSCAGNTHVPPAAPPGSLFIGSWLGIWQGTRAGAFSCPLLGGCLSQWSMLPPQWALLAPPPTASPQPTKVARPKPPFLPAGHPWSWRTVSLQSSVLALLPPAPRRPPEPSSLTTGRGWRWQRPQPSHHLSYTCIFCKTLAIWRQHCSSLFTGTEISSQRVGMRFSPAGPRFLPPPPYPHPYEGGWSLGEAQEARPSCPDTSLLPFPEAEAWALGSQRGTPVGGGRPDSHLFPHSLGPAANRLLPARTPARPCAPTRAPHASPASSGSSSFQSILRAPLRVPGTPRALPPLCFCSRMP